MITLENVYNFCFENLLYTRVTTNNVPINIVARCPICGDSRRNKKSTRLNITYYHDEKCIFHCFRCDASGSIAKLYSILKNTSISQAYKELSSFDLDNIFKKPKIKEHNSESSIICFDDIINKNCLSETSIPKSKAETALITRLLKFKKERKLSVPLYIAKDGKYRNRIIIPVFEGKRIIYFQARSIYDYQEPKYLNPKIDKGNFIVNSDYFDKDKSIIITEGLADAYSIGLQGTTALGTAINDEYLEKLLYHTNNNVIIALDNDPAGFKKLKSILEKSKFNKRLFYFLMPYKYKKIKDMNELLITHNINNLYSFMIENSYDYMETNIKITMDEWRHYEDSETKQRVLHSGRTNNRAIQKHTQSPLDQIKF